MDELSNQKMKYSLVIEKEGVVVCHRLEALSGKVNKKLFLEGKKCKQSATEARIIEGPKLRNDEKLLFGIKTQKPSQLSRSGV